MPKRKTIVLTLRLNANESALLDIYKGYYGINRDSAAARQAFEHGLRDFMGTNTGNPDLPELKEIEL